MGAGEHGGSAHGASSGGRGVCVHMFACGLQGVASVVEVEWVQQQSAQWHTARATDDTV